MLCCCCEPARAPLLRRSSSKRGGPPAQPRDGAPEGGVAALSLPRRGCGRGAQRPVVVVTVVGNGDAQDAHARTTATATHLGRVDSWNTWLSPRHLAAAGWPCASVWGRSYASPTREPAAPHNTHSTSKLRSENKLIPAHDRELPRPMPLPKLISKAFGYLVFFSQLFFGAN